MEAKVSALIKRAVVVRIGGHAGTVNILQDKFYPVKKKANMVGIFRQTAQGRSPVFTQNIETSSQRESEAQSAQRAGCEADWGSVVLEIGQPLSQLR